MMLILVVVAVAIVDVTPILGDMQTTDQRIAAFNYAVENHVVETPDGYVLTMYRIPYSPKLQNENKPRPVAFLQHGLLSSSDCWILNGPDDALAYLLVDAGYDVWLGNARGNTYSRNNTKLKPSSPQFWDFSWHEIAVYDMPTMIDYVLDITNETALHYVGHSQGTTVFFILMSLMPEYNDKIKTSHMLAPVAYCKHMKSPVAKIGGPLLGIPNIFTELLGKTELLPTTELQATLGAEACSDYSITQPVCSNALFLMVGFDPKHFNHTLLADVVATYPAGSSTKQALHYAQEYVSGFFRQYDYGIFNSLHYGRFSPPNYEEKYITAPVRLYFGANDWFASVTDVLKLQGLLPNVVDSYLVPIPEWNHLDFLWAFEVKELLYDRIIAAANHYEQTGEQLVW